MGRMTGVNEDWYVNFGEFDRGRDWSDARDLGFVSAGWGLRYSDPLRKVPVGARIWVYRAPMTGRDVEGGKRLGGYIGRGIVTGEAVPADVASFTRYGRPITMRELHDSGELKGNYLGWINPDDAEYVLPVAWERTSSPQRPLTKPGLFSNQNTAVRFDRSKVRHAKTLDFLYASFPTSKDW